MLTNQQMLKKSIELIHEILSEADSKGITLQTKKSRVSDISLVTYEKQTATIMRKAAKRFHVYDLMQVTKEMIVEILKGYQNPYTLKKAIHSLAFLQYAMEQTRVIRKPPILINKETILGYLREQHIVRRIADSTVYQASQAEVFAVIDQIKRMRTPFKRLVITLLLFALYTGARVDGALNVCNQDIVELENGRVDVHLLEKGGLKRVVRIWDSEAIAFLKVLKSQCRSDRSRIFTFRSQRTRKVKSNKAAAKTIQAVIRTAAIKTNRIPEGQHFTTHSARKAFARSRMLMYTLWSLSELYAEIEERCQFSDIIMLKFRRNMRNTPKRLMTIRKKLILFLITLDIGHFRLNVLSYYLNVRELDSILKQQNTLAFMS